MDDFFKQLGKSPLIHAMMFWKHFDRAGPAYWIFIFAVAIFILGIILETLRFLFWIGSLVLLIYLVSIIYFIVAKLR